MFLILTNFFLYVNSQLAGRPEIVGDILPEVQQRLGAGVLNCTVVNDNVEAGTVEWAKLESMAGQPFFISRGDNIVHGINIDIEGKWKYEINKIPGGSRVVYSLTIRGLEEEDAGLYMCRIRINGNNDVSVWPTKYAKLTVQIPPTVRTSGEVVYELPQNIDINITCDSYGIPTPNITWKREDGGLLQNGGFRSRGATLQFLNVQKEDRGNYICIADNNVRPPADYTVEVAVFYAPECYPVQKTVGQAQNRQIDAKLECICSGYPAPTVRWEKLNRQNQGRQVISDNDKYDLTKQFSTMLYNDQTWHTLRIVNVQGNDFGEYYCIAQNPYGENGTSLTLFETMECQGANCPSFGTGSANAVCSSLPLVTLMTVVVKYYLNV